MKDLAAYWRREAQRLRHWGAESQARALETCADELQAATRRHDYELLTLEEAARESGLAYSTLQRRVAEGDIPNAGEKGRPRIRRRDLPIRAGQAEDVDLDAVRALRARRRAS